MSRPDTDDDTKIVEPLICDYCGTYITEPDQQCAALADGRCRP